MCNIITKSSASANISPLLTNMATAYSSYDVLLNDFAKVCVPFTNFAPDDVLKNWLFSNDNTMPAIQTYLNGGNTFCQVVSNTFSTDQIVPINSTAVVAYTAQTHPYQTHMRTVFTNMFFVIFGQLKETYCVTSGNNSVCALVSGSYLSLSTPISVLLRYVEDNVYTYLINTSDGTDVSLEQYLAKLFIDVTVTYPAAHSNNGLNMFHYNLFFITCLPYFCYLNIVSYLPNSVVSATNKAPRSGVTRGIAVLATYKFVTYTLYGTYQMIASYDPSSADALLLRQAIDINTMSVFNTEFNRFITELNANQTSIQDTIANIGTLDDTNQLIMMARSNAKNIASNETTVSAALGKATTIKWVWIGILIVYLIAFGAIYGVVALGLIKANGKVNDALNGIILQSFMGFSSVLFIAICIVGIVNIA